MSSAAAAQTSFVDLGLPAHTGSLCLSGLAAGEMGVLGLCSVCVVALPAVVAGLLLTPVAMSPHERFSMALCSFQLCYVNRVLRLLLALLSFLLCCTRICDPLFHVL
jgi:hypothetical protein